MEFIDLKSQLSLMRSNIDTRIKKVLDHGKFIMGPEVYELEEKLAEYVGVSHCISCANGTDALQISLMALGIGRDDIVFTTSFSFFATAEVIPLVGATPYFVDIDPETYNLCPISLRNAIIESKLQGRSPKAVITVDMFGLPANYVEIQLICDEFKLHLIEDGAQGFGGQYNDRRAGSFGDIATTSFFPAKPLGCYGDGGAIFTDDDKLAETCRSLRVHGKGSDKYCNQRIGLNSRLDTLQAAILLEKFAHFDNELLARQKLSDWYQYQLSDLFSTPKTPSNTKSAWAQYTVQCETREQVQKVRELLSQYGVPTAIYYPIPLNEQSALIGCLSAETPNTKVACKSVFSLPMHGYMDEQTLKIIERAIQALRQLTCEDEVTIL